MSDSSRTVEDFRALHESGCFVLPNPWDVGTAIYLARCGFPALATTSSGFAFTRGLPDEVSALSRDDVLAHIAEIVGATSLPVNADFQNGYADEPDELARNVTLCVETGVAGLSIEDATGRDKDLLYERELAIDRIRAARAAIEATGTCVVLTARCEAWLFSGAEARGTALDRLVAFAEAGADCLYAPGVRDPDAIEEIVKTVAPKPVNVLMSAPVEGLTVARLAGLGVRRISIGSALARTAWGAFMRAASDIAERGVFDELAGAAPFGELNDLFRERG